MSIISKIKHYTQEILQLNATLPVGLLECSKCGGDRHAIKFHSRRERILLIIIDNFVQKITLFLTRWKCLTANHIFTYYPDFIIPYKHYSMDDILKFSREYVLNDDSTYRKAACSQNLAIGYAGEKEKIDERQFTGSTVWRWVGFLGCQKKLISESFDLIRQKSPSSSIFRQITPVPPQKYRSFLRKNLLVNAFKYFQVESEFKKLFGLHIFTKFATRFRGT